MLGYTGTYRGEPVSVQGSGMGQPSLSIYVNELFRDYDVQPLVRVGLVRRAHREAADARRRDRLRRLHRLVDEPASASRASTTPRSPTSGCSAARRTRRPSVGRRRRADVHVGQIFSSDSFYSRRARAARRGWSTTACSRSRWRPARSTRSPPSTVGEALAICTVSDHVVTGEETTAPGARADLRRHGRDRPRRRCSLASTGLSRRRRRPAPPERARSGRSAGSTRSPVRRSRTPRAHLLDRRRRAAPPRPAGRSPSCSGSAVGARLVFQSTTR